MLPLLQMLAFLISALVCTALPSQRACHTPVCERIRRHAETALQSMEELVSQGVFPADTVENSIDDAFLQCYWLALVTQSDGASVASTVGDMAGKTEAEAEMDKVNIARGVEIGTANSDPNAAREACVASARDGTLKTLA
jgi:hypothetical protein